MTAESLAAAGLTPLQYGAMGCLNPQDGEPGIDQVGLAARLRIDRNSVSVLIDELEAQREEGLISWAISQVTNEKHREVLKLTYDEKLTAEEIAERLGISRDNAYQRRSRGLKELKKILDEHNA